MNVRNALIIGGRARIAGSPGPALRALSESRGMLSEAT